MNIVDALVAITVAWSALRGANRGLFMQAGVVVAIVAGLVVASWAYAALAEGWGRGGTQFPLALRFGIAVFAGIFTFGLLQLAAEHLGQRVNESTLGPLNRFCGLALGLVSGLVLATFLLLFVVSAPVPPRMIRGAQRAIAESWSAPQLFRAGERCALKTSAIVPGSKALARAFARAAMLHPAPEPVPTGRRTPA